MKLMFGKLCTTARAYTNSRGAMAGIVVSLCLHPMDTIKTVVQSCRADQKPLHYIGRSIISETGGCASIATSFIFTPRERVKQHMQVVSHYRNSWNALIEVVQKGGLPSLYTGWGAVLCRNVPHSAIKIPGSIAWYNDVFNTLMNIGKHEGLKVCTGFRGLTPRLVMHMLQGALFFASYESVKSLRSLEIPQTTTQVIQHGRMEDHSSTLLSLLFVSA